MPSLEQLPDAASASADESAAETNAGGFIAEESLIKTELDDTLASIAPPQTGSGANERELTAVQESRLIAWLDDRLLLRSRLIKRRVMRRDDTVTLAEIRSILFPALEVLSRIPKTRNSARLTVSYLTTIIDTLVDDIELVEEMLPTVAFALLGRCDTVLHELLDYGDGNLVDLTARTRLDAILARARQVMFTLYAAPEHEKALSDIFDKSIALI